MKSLKQIKKELHECIDGICDEKELMVIYENTMKHLKSDLRNVETNENDHLFNNQQKRVNEWINYESPNEKRRDKESKKSMARWFNEGGKNAC